MSLGIRNFAERKTAGTKNLPEGCSRNPVPNDEEMRMKDANSVIPADERNSREEDGYKL